MEKGEKINIITIYRNMATIRIRHDAKLFRCMYLNVLVYHTKHIINAMYNVYFSELNDSVMGSRVDTSPSKLFSTLTYRGVKNGVGKGF